MVRVWVDFGSVVVSGRRSAVGTCHGAFGKEPRQTHQIVATVEHRLLIFVAWGNRKGYDPVHVGGRLWANTKGIFVASDGHKGWVSVWSASSRPATDDGANENVNDSGFSPGFGNGRQIDVYPCPCASFCPSCPSSPLSRSSLGVA